jgi:CBS domain-containing protein
MFSQRIRKVMDPAAMVTVGPEATVSQAAQLIASNAVGAVLVVQGGVLQGIFTASDAVRRVLAKGLDPSSTRLIEVMSSPVRTVDPDATYGSALQLMHEYALRQLPVVEAGRARSACCVRAMRWTPRWKSSPARCSAAKPTSTWRTAKHPNMRPRHERVRRAPAVGSGLTRHHAPVEEPGVLGRGKLGLSLGHLKPEPGPLA